MICINFCRNNSDSSNVTLSSSCWKVYQNLGEVHDCLSCYMTAAVFLYDQLTHAKLWLAVESSRYFFAKRRLNAYLLKYFSLLLNSTKSTEKINKKYQKAEVKEEKNNILNAISFLIFLIIIVEQGVTGNFIFASKLYSEKIFSFIHRNKFIIVIIIHFGLKNKYLMKSECILLNAV